jgi:hypothetical protein
VPDPLHRDWLSQIKGLNSASPTRSVVDKSRCSQRCFYHASEGFPSYSVTLCNYWAARPTRVLTLTPTTDGRCRQPPSEGTGDVGSPVEAVRPRAAPGRGRRTQRNVGPERPAGANRGPHGVDQPAAGACPRPGRPSARVERSETPHRRCGAVLCCSRWSA